MESSMTHRVCFAFANHFLDIYNAKDNINYMIIQTCSLELKSAIVKSERAPSSPNDSFSEGTATVNEIHS